MGVARPEQVIDVLGLWGDASDNIPGVPGIGEKTASKLIAQYGSVENLLEHAEELKGKQRENLEQYREQALLSKRLATINLAVPLELRLDDLKLRPANEEAVKRLLIEFEFNAIGRRLFGDELQGRTRVRESVNGTPQGAHDSAYSPGIGRRANPIPTAHETGSRRRGSTHSSSAGSERELTSTLRSTATEDGSAAAVRGVRARATGSG